LQALGQAEDAEDVAAADVAREEVTAELAEFDENIPWDEREGELRKQQEETSKVCTDSGLGQVVIYPRDV